MKTFRVTLTMDLRLLGVEPKDLTLEKLRAYLDMDLNEYVDGRHALCVETFHALFSPHWAMTRAVADVIQKRREAAGAPKMLRSGPRAKTNAALAYAHDQMKRALIHVSELEFRSVEEIDDDH